MSDFATDPLLEPAGDALTEAYLESSLPTLDLLGDIGAEFLEALEIFSISSDYYFLSVSNYSCLETTAFIFPAASFGPRTSD